jgi:itaconate CoA-transferase
MAFLPLAGITVIAVEQAVAVPFATRQLADLGARVIKIERPGTGDFARSYDTAVKGLASHFVWVNRGKESLTLDLKRDEAGEIMTRLLSGADVFVQNLGPGAARRLGLDSQTLCTRYPRLIACALTGYGSSGPYADKKAYDMLVQSEVGLVSITGTEEVPSKVGISIADIAGGMYAYSGVLTALLVRGQTGRGTSLEVSLFEALGEWMGYAMYYTLGGSAPKRTGASHATIAPYGPYRTSDGQVVFGIHNNHEWARFCAEVLEDSALAADRRFLSNSDRVQHRTEMEAAIERVLGRLSSRDVLERLDRAQIANARINSVQQFLEHPQLSARQAWRHIDSPVGPIPALLPPVRMDGVDSRAGSIPALGQHTHAILEELKFDRETIARWTRDGVI